jgi:hypothetical protein
MLYICNTYHGILFKKLSLYTITMANAVIMQTSNEKKATNYITKQKYKRIEESIDTYVTERDLQHIKDDILRIICDDLEFDPNLKSYDKDKIQKKCMETGKNTYELFARKYYEKNKEAIDKRNAERTRQMRAIKKEQNKT